MRVYGGTNVTRITSFKDGFIAFTDQNLIRNADSLAPWLLHSSEGLKGWWIFPDAITMREKEKNNPKNRTRKYESWWQKVCASIAFLFCIYQESSHLEINTSTNSGLCFLQINDFPIFFWFQTSDHSWVMGFKCNGIIYRYRCGIFRNWWTNHNLGTRCSQGLHLPKDVLADLL